VVFLIASLSLTLALYFIYVLIRWTDVGLISVVFAELLLMTIGERQAFVGGYHLSVQDLIYMCLLAAGVVRTLQRAKTFTAPRALAWGYLSLFAFSLVRGVADNGVATASNEARGYVGALVAVLYFLDADIDEMLVRRYVKIYLVFAAALCFIAVLAAAGLQVGTINLGWATEGDVNGRFLPADCAGAIGFAWLLSLAVRQYHKRGLLTQLLTLVFLVFAVYLRHRTVWVMLLASIAAMIFLDRRIFLRVLPAALLAAVAVSGIVIYANTHENVAGEEAFAESASSTSTWEWRVNGWVDLFFDQEQTPVTEMIGKSMGSGFRRIDPDSHQLVTAPPHDEFLQDYLRVGALGTLCLLAFTAWPIFALYRVSKIDPWPLYPSASTWQIISLASLVYSIAYGLMPHQYALIGIANALATKISRYRREVRDQNWDALAQGGEVAPDPHLA
jgi:hypothetical protein